MKKLKEILLPYFKSVRFVLITALIIIAIYYATELVSSPSTINVVAGFLVIALVGVFCLHVVASWAKCVTVSAEEKNKNNEGGNKDEKEFDDSAVDPMGTVADSEDSQLPLEWSLSVLYGR